MTEQSPRAAAPAPRRRGPASTENGQRQVRVAEIARRASMSSGQVMYPSWILWMEAWARAPHNRQVSQFLEELLAPWREDLAARRTSHPVSASSSSP